MKTTSDGRSRLTLNSILNEISSARKQLDGSEFYIPIQEALKNIRAAESALKELIRIQQQEAQ